MNADFQGFVEGVRRYLSAQWPIGRAASLNQSSAARVKIWAGLTDLGIASLGRPQTGGLAQSLPLLRELGASDCPVPVPDIVALNATLWPDSAPWIEQIEQGFAIPSFADGAASSSSAERVVLSGQVLQGKVGPIDCLGATHIALLIDAGVYAPALAWAPLSQLGIRLSRETAYLESVLCRVECNAASAEIYALSRDRAKDLRIAWRFLRAVRATGALVQALAGVVEYAKVRHQFGSAIGTFQAVQHKLANIKMALDGALLTQENAARTFDADRARWRLDAEAAIAATDPALRLGVLDVLHVYGAIGYAEEHEATRYFRRVHLDLAGADGHHARAMLCAGLIGSTGIGEPDLGDSAESFRKTVKIWLDENWSETERRAEAERPAQERGFDPRFSRRLGDAGWIALTWPREWGGLAKSRLEQLALTQELSRVSAPTQVHSAAGSLIAPALLLYGSEEQKREFLPRIARGQLTICLGYSEPQAGSDLASLRTRAVRDGDHYVINGQKMWGTITDRADYVWLAARTDMAAKPHAGISVFLIPLSTPGVTIRPGMALNGKTFSTQFYDNVRVPESSLVGEPNAGWQLITRALADERILMGSFVMQVGTALSDLANHLNAAGPISDWAAHIIGSLVSEVAIANALLVRSVKMTQEGRTAVAEAAMTKAYTGELMERFGEAAYGLVGPAALLSRGSAGAILNGELERILRTGPMQVIGGGANEIQRSLIAQHGLGLPRR